MIDNKEITKDDQNKFFEEKQIEINRIITHFKFSKESLLIDQYRNNELFNQIKEIAKSKGGFINNNNRKILWNYLFYRRKNQKGIIDLIKINQNIELFISKLNLSLQKKELTEEKLNGINEYKVILNDIPRTCKNIISKDSLNSSNSNNIINTSSKNNIISNYRINNDLISNISNGSPEIFMFACDIMRYKYLQGLLNIIFYFKKIFNNENTINALNVYFEYFFKDFVDKELNEENNDENISLISSIITDLYNHLYPDEQNDKVEEFIPILCNKWIISDFISEIKDINKGFRILDYLIVNEPYVKYILATVLIYKYNNIILDKMAISIESSYDNIFHELKKEDLNFIDFDEIINDVEKINDKKGKEIKALLNEKYGKQFVYTFNLNNQGLISYYKDLFKILEIKKPRKEFKIDFGFIKYYKYFFIIIAISFILYFIFDYINKNRFFW